MLRFGEAAVFRHSFSQTGRFLRGAKVGKADNRFQKGIFVGKTYETNEYLFVTENGVYHSRAVKRLPPDQQVDIEMLTLGKGVPWDTKSAGTPGRKRIEPLVAAVPASASDILDKEAAKEESRMDPAPEVRAQDPEEGARHRRVHASRGSRRGG